MSGYIIVHVKIHDPQEFKRYLKAFSEEFKEFPGKILVATNDAEILEGDLPSKLRTVVMKFPSMDEAREWYRSEKYQKIAPIRWGSATGDMMLVQGLS